MLLLKSRVLQVGGLVATALVVSSCASMRAGKTTGFDHLTPASTLFAISLELKVNGDAKVMESCLLQLKKTGELKPSYHAIDWQVGTLAFDLKPGEYRLEAIDCGRRGNWQLGNTIKRAFTIKPGLVQWFGKVFVDYDSVKDSLKTRVANRDEVRAAAIELLEKIPEMERGRMVSVYTRRSVSLETLRSRSSTQRQVSIKKHESFTRLDTDQLMTKFDACDASEMKSNPLQLGLLSYTVNYHGSEFKNLEKTKSDHTFSEDYAECVEKALKQFRPVKVKSPELIEYQVIL